MGSINRLIFFIWRASWCWPQGAKEGQINMCWCNRRCVCTRMYAGANLLHGGSPRIRIIRGLRVPPFHNPVFHVLIPPSLCCSAFQLPPLPSFISASSCPLHLLIPPLIPSIFHPSFLRPLNSTFSPCISIHPSDLILLHLSLLLPSAL